MSKQTSVEWLIDKHFGGVENVTPDFKKHIEQAKKMEKNKMIEFAELCMNYLNDKDSRLLTNFDRIEHFYNNKYGK